MYQNDHECELLNNILRHKVHYRRIPGSGVNLQQFPFKPYPENDDEIIFNFVARIMKGKGIREYLDCAERVKADCPNARFIIYGDYDDESYRPRIEELEKRGIVEYGGIQLDMKPCIEKAHAVIHPSYYEGMTNVVLEHSAMGRVCLGSDVPGIREGIEDGKTGYLFQVRDVDSMVEKVETFIRLPHGEKAKMGKAAREKMEREFSREIVTNIYLEEIERILAL
jgi:galacturonosyltransferase